MDVIKDLYTIIKERKEQKIEGSYTNYLFEKGTDKILKKVGEECTEVIVASKNDDKNELVNETCDLIYHMLVLLANSNIPIDDIEKELLERRKKIGNKKNERKEIQTY
ncbi:phosphoribosyl-ATP diphosphatase [Clostridium aestuarii]|uniref:Phosphoribosyl-ATP pyrophosphatase n=1 Tax=Clostridium aestuarii TaxID=338193 RepID=A0ABT4CX16_9CLOT|nr:phosphoribosyl-ATP diphosphatase [Clostridium aestuarii]MCY6482887.1 phosphoribosyl-ATP diphosphatase [Clostridium aestuarii]